MTKKLSFFLVWLPTLIFKPQYAESQTQVEYGTCRSLRLNDTFLAASVHSVELTCPWIKPNDNESSCPLLESTNHKENGGNPCFHRPDQCDSKNLVHQKADGQSLLVANAGLHTGNPRSLEFSEIQNSGEESSEKTPVTNDSILEPKKIGVIERGIANSERGTANDWGTNSPLSKTEIVTHAFEGEFSSNTPRLLKPPHHGPNLRHSEPIQNESPELDNISAGLSEEITQSSEFIGPQNEQGLNTGFCENTKIPGQNQTSYIEPSDENSRGKPIYLSGSDEDGKKADPANTEVAGDKKADPANTKVAGDKAANTTGTEVDDDEDGDSANRTSTKTDDDDEEDEPWRRELHKLPSHESITGGEPISIKKMPFLALLKMDLGSGTSYCTSSIISEKWVLTAAHCVVRIRSPNDVEVIAGQTGFSEASVGDKTQRRKGAAVYIHPSFKHAESPGNGDVALIKVRMPFVFDKIHVSKVKLRGRSWFKEVRNENCTSAGWGRQKFYAQNTGPLQSFRSVALHGEASCPCVPSEQKETVVCLERSQGKGICKGDSGGPLICDGELVGVAHVLFPTPFLCWQIFSGEPECGDNNWIDIYMYTCPYLDWIKSYVGEKVPPKPKTCAAVRPTHQALFIAAAVVTLPALTQLIFSKL